MKSTMLETGPGQGEEREKHAERTCWACES